MDNKFTDPKDVTIQQLQKRIQALEVNYRDLLDNFESRVRVTSNRLYKEKIAAIRKIVR